MSWYQKNYIVSTISWLLKNFSLKNIIIIGLFIFFTQISNKVCYCTPTSERIIKIVFENKSSIYTNLSHDRAKYAVDYFHHLANNNKNYFQFGKIISPYCNSRRSCFNHPVLFINSVEEQLVIFQQFTHNPINHRDFIEINKYIIDGVLYKQHVTKQLTVLNAQNLIFNNIHPNILFNTQNKINWIKEVNRFLVSLNTAKQ